MNIYELFKTSSHVEGMSRLVDSCVFDQLIGLDQINKFPAKIDATLILKYSGWLFIIFQPIRVLKTRVA